MFVWLLGHKVTHPYSGRPPSASGLGGCKQHTCVCHTGLSLYGVHRQPRLVCTWPRPPHPTGILNPGMF